MLRIRREQEAALLRAAQVRFVYRMRERLRARFSRELADLCDDALAWKIDRAIARAAEYGLRGQQDAARFLGLCARHGWDFLDRPGWEWTREWLETPGSSPTMRLKRVLERCEAQAAQDDHDGPRLDPTLSLEKL